MATPLSPEWLWLTSCRLHQRGHRRRARALKTANYLLYRAILPVECQVADDVRFLHRAMNVVVHPNTRVGPGVTISHGVTIGAVDDASSFIHLEAHAFIGAGAILLAGYGKTLTVGTGASIGPGVVLTKDAEPRSKTLAASPTQK